MSEVIPFEGLALASCIALGVALFIVSTVGFLVKGPARWVRISVAMLLADFLVLHSLVSGWQAGLQTVGILVGTIFATVSFAFLSWRHPINKVFSPATAEDCPKHARNALERWTRELRSLDFEIQTELRTVWQIQGSDRVTFVRFMTHHSEPLWVEIHALDNPKVVARMVVSDKGDGRAVMTCDRQADQELFDDSLTAIQRLSSTASCTDLVDAHRKLAMTTEGRLSRVEDPAQAHVEIYAAWVQRLLAMGQVRQVDACWIGLKPSSIPGLVLKTWAAWFH